MQFSILKKRKRVERQAIDYKRFKVYANQSEYMELVDPDSNKYTIKNRRQLEFEH